MEHEIHEHKEHATHHAPARKEKDDSLSIPIAIVLAGLLVAGAIVFSEKTAAPAVGAQVPSRVEAGADGDQAPVDILALKPRMPIL
jgi:flagellar basal body-associated protein FliL